MSNTVVSTVEEQSAFLPDMRAEVAKFLSDRPTEDVTQDRIAAKESVLSVMHWCDEINRRLASRGKWPEIQAVDILAKVLGLPRDAVFQTIAVEIANQVYEAMQAQPVAPTEVLDLVRGMADRHIKSILERISPGA